MQYRNGIFTYHGRINRLTYILQNILWNTLAFPFIYYSLLVSFAQFDPSYSTPFMIIRWIFVIPLRIIDLRRIRDIIDRELTTFETMSVVLIFSIPYVDLVTSLFLASFRSYYFAKSHFEGEIKNKNQMEAGLEEKILQNKKLFEEGKISRAVFEANRDKLKKS